MTPMPRTAVSLYVALAFHALLLLGLALSPPSQNTAGPGLGLSIPGAGLSTKERQAATTLPASEPPPVADAQPTPVVPIAEYRLPPQQRVAEVRSKPSKHPLPPSPAVAASAPEPNALENESSSSGAGAPRASQSGGGGSNTYYARLRAHLAGFRHALPGGLGTASARVRFRVSPDGWISELALEESSGIAALDSEALDLLRRAAPLPPPPGGLELRLVVPVSLSGPR